MPRRRRMGTWPALALLVASLAGCGEGGETAARAAADSSGRTEGTRSATGGALRALHPDHPGGHRAHQRLRRRRAARGQLRFGLLVDGRRAAARRVDLGGPLRAHAVPRRLGGRPGRRAPRAPVGRRLAESDDPGGRAPRSPSSSTARRSPPAARRGSTSSPAATAARSTCASSTRPTHGRSSSGCADARILAVLSWIPRMRQSRISSATPSVPHSPQRSLPDSTVAGSRAISSPSRPERRARAVEAASACPTFSWSAAPGATGYELAVFRLDRGEEPELVWRREVVAGSATTWSPSRSDCLEAGGRYAWTVRALGTDSPARQPRGGVGRSAALRVPGAPSDDEVAAALATLERWRAARGEDRRRKLRCR